MSVACEKDGTVDKVSDLCQLAVYVVWTGTDSKGNYFTSFAKRLSMYAGEVSEPASRVLCGVISIFLLVFSRLAASYKGLSFLACFGR